MRIIGTRLFLRPLNLSDAPRLVSLVNASARELREFIPAIKDGKITHKEEEEYLLRAVQEMNLNQAMHFGIALKPSSDLIGAIATHPIDWLNESAMIGYWVATAFTGKGFATEAALLMLEGLFMELKLHRVVATAAIDNLASNRVLEKVGFRFEGALKQAGKVAPSRWKDLNAYAILADEYKSLRKALFEKLLGGAYPKISLT